MTYFTATLVGSFTFALCGPTAKANFLSANKVTVYETKWRANVSLTHSSNSQCVYALNYVLIREDGNYLLQQKAMDAFMFGGLRKGIKWFVITYLVVKPFA